MELTVRKIGYWAPVQVDEDGTPMWCGERLVEVQPGEWADPFMAALMGQLAESIPDL